MIECIKVSDSRDRQTVSDSDIVHCWYLCHHRHEWQSNRLTSQCQKYQDPHYLPVLAPANHVLLNVLGTDPHLVPHSNISRALADSTHQASAQQTLSAARLIQSTHVPPLWPTPTGASPPGHTLSQRSCALATQTDPVSLAQGRVGIGGTRLWHHVTPDWNNVSR